MAQKVSQKDGAECEPFLLEEHPALHKRLNSSKGEGEKIFFPLTLFHLLVRDSCCIWPF